MAQRWRRNCLACCEAIARQLRQLQAAQNTFTWLSIHVEDMHTESICGASRWKQFLSNGEIARERGGWISAREEGGWGRERRRKKINTIFPTDKYRRELFSSLAYTCNSTHTHTAQHNTRQSTVYRSFRTEQSITAIDLIICDYVWHICAMHFLVRVHLLAEELRLSHGTIVPRLSCALLLRTFVGMCP